MTLSDDWDLTELEEIPFTGATQLKPVAATPRCCSGCGCPLPAAHNSIYCGSPKSRVNNRCKQRACRQRRVVTVTQVTSVTQSLEAQIEKLEQMIEHLTSQLLGGSFPAPVNPPKFGLPAAPVSNFDVDIEIKKDEKSGARASENLRRTLMAMYNGEGVWASK